MCCGSIPAVALPVVSAETMAVMRWGRNAAPGRDAGIQGVLARLLGRGARSCDRRPPTPSRDVALLASSAGGIMA